MIDSVILAAIRRFWTQNECETVYQRLLTAYLARTEKITVIVGKASEGDSASGQVVVQKEDYREWMDTLETRLSEYAAGDTTTHTGTEHVDFSNRFI